MKTQNTRNHLQGLVPLFAIVLTPLLALQVWDQYGYFTYEARISYVQPRLSDILVTGPVAGSEHTKTFQLGLDYEFLASLAKNRSVSERAIDSPDHAGEIHYGYSPPATVRFRARPPYPWEDGHKVTSYTVLK